MRQNTTRRRVLLGTGALVAGTTTSIVALTDNTTATVEGEYSIPNASKTVTDSQVQDVRLGVDTVWSFDANAPMNTVELEVHVGATTDTLDLIARHQKTDLSKESLSGETTLSGSLLSASDFDIEDFQPTDGELTTTVISELRMYVLKDGTREADAVHQTTFDVTVSDEELTVSTSVGGTGSVSFDTG